MAYDYSSMINAANQTYKDTISGYQKTLADTQARQDALSAQYGKLGETVIAGLSGSAEAAETAARDTYSQAFDRMRGQMTGLGLSGTSVGANLQRGITSDYAKTQAQIKADFATPIAQAYQTIGLAGLGYSGQALAAQQALNQAQLGYMGAWGQNQNQLAAQYAGYGVQERGQDLDTQTKMYLGQLDADTRIRAAQISKPNRPMWGGLPQVASGNRLGMTG